MMHERDYTETNVRALLAKRHVKLSRETVEGVERWVVTSDTGLCEVANTLRDAYFAGLTLGSTT